MKTAKILKKSVLKPGNNWITLLNSVNLSKKNAVTPVNFHLYHYASNNPVRYTDPDGRDTNLPFAIDNSYMLDNIPSECVKAIYRVQSEEWERNHNQYPIRNEFLLSGTNGRDELREKIADCAELHVVYKQLSDWEQIESFASKVQVINDAVEKVNKVNDLLGKPNITGASVTILKKFAKGLNIAEDIIKHVSTFDVKAKAYIDMCEKLASYSVKIKELEQKGYKLLSVSIKMKIDNFNFIQGVESGSAFFKKGDSYFMINLGE